MYTSKNKLMLGFASVAMSLLGAVGSASAATTVNLTAQPATATMPDGAAIPMWGYCGAAVSGGAGTAVGAICGTAVWSPGPTIIVPIGDALTINLTNNLKVPTSVTILGQFGGGLGNPTKENSPLHGAQTGTTWPVSGGPAVFTPPMQGQRARSFVNEAAPGATGNTASYTWSGLKAGTYLYETATRPSLQAPMGLYGVLIVTNSSVTNATATAAATAITAQGTAFLAGALNGVTVGAVTYDSDAAFLVSEIDPAQNIAVDAAINNAGFKGETAKWNPTCGAAQTCYPPAVNYAPTYLLLNGKPYDPSNPGANAAQLQIAGAPSGTLASSGNVMLRVLNAGLRTHVPALVGLPMMQIAEDGNRAPGTPQTVSELYLPAGKTRDVLIQPASNATATTAATLYNPAAFGFFDRALGLSSGGRPNGGSQGYLGIVDTATGGNSSTFNTWLGSTAGKPVAATPTVNPDPFTLAANLKTFSGNVLANDVGVATAVIATQGASGTVTMSASGNFIYTPTGPLITSDSFTYTGSNASGVVGTTTVTLTVPVLNSAITARADNYTSRVATLFRTMTGNGVLANDLDSAGLAMTAVLDPTVPQSGCTVTTFNSDGTFVATNASSTGGSCTFGYIASDSQGSSSKGSVSITFLPGSGLGVTVQDALSIVQNGATAAAGTPPATASTQLTDYMWLIEEDPTFHTVPGATPVVPAGSNPALTISNSFHVSHTNIVAAGCTGNLSCGTAQTSSDPNFAPSPTSLPSDVNLDPSKHYFISVLPGDAGNSFIAGLSGDPTVPGNCTFSNTNTPNMSAGKATDCGHTIGGAQIVNACTPTAGATTCTGRFAPVTVLVDPNPLKPAQLSIIAFEDNNPINGDLDDGETGLGGFNVVIFDAAGRSGDPAGQITYDAFNMPLTNWLLGKPGCPNEENRTEHRNAGLIASQQNDLVGAIYTCPDGHRNITAIEVKGRIATITTATNHRFTRGTAVDISGVNNALLNGSFTVRSHNARTFTVTLPGAIPASQLPIIVAKGASVRDPATYSLAGHALVKNIMPGRFDVLMHPGAAREGDGETWLQVGTLEGTPANDAFARAGEPAYFQEFGPPGYHAFVGWMNPDRIQTVNKLVGEGHSITGTVTNIHMSRPSQIFNYDSTTRDPLKQTVCFVGLNTTGGNGATAAFAKCDDQGNFTLTNVPSGSHQVVVWDQWLDQIIAYFNVTIDPAKGANQTIKMGDMPVLSWFTLVQEHAFVYNDANCPVNAIAAAAGSQPALKSALAACTTTDLAQIPITLRFRDGSISNTLQTDSNGIAAFNELFPLFNWYVAEVDQTRYAPLTAHVVVDGGGQPDCTTFNGTTGGSTRTSGCTSVGGLQPGVANSHYPTGEPSEHTYTNGELYFGLQGFISQTEKIDWGKTVLQGDANGGFSGVVVYASTRGFDDPHLEVQFKWEPAVPRVPVRLYQKVTAADGTTSLKMVSMTTTTSWDDVANNTFGGPTGTGDPINNPLGLPKPVCPGQVTTDPYALQVLGTDYGRCYDGFHNWNQVQPLTYDGYYQFPTIYQYGINADGSPIPYLVNGVDVNANPIALPNGQYTIEIVMPPGYEIVKEEDKNILIGDAWVAPPAQQFAALSNIFIQPDQATISSAYNLNGPGSVQSLLDFVDGSPQLPLCAGTLHRVPDYLSLFPQSGQVAPFAGSDRPLCDRKDVQIMAGQNGTANFFVYSNTPRAAKYTGIILDDASAEFNVAAPDFGEKFGVPYVAVSIRDQYGIEIERTYGDQWGGYNGMTPSSWQVNVPNPAGYSPNMLVTCMNDPGPITVNGVVQIDPQYMPSYSNFCYTNPFMPGLTTYLDTPLLPVGAFASNYVSGYNPVDCAYPDATPAISRVDGDVVHGPWIPAAGHVLKIKALGAVQVPNAAYLGPSQAGTSLNGQKTVARTYNFAGGTGVVTLDGTPVTSGVTWGDNEIDVTVPSMFTAGSYELGITNANGKSSVDTVTVTIGGNTPLVLTAPSNSVTVGGASHVVQNAIDNATPGDLIILDAGVYNELVVMWKPVRLQGVGAASVVINAAKYPTDKLEVWRPTINNLFGVDTISGNASSHPQVDPLPGQEITGGIVFLEPSVLATEEGAGITVLAKSRGEDDSCTSTAKSNYYDSTKLQTVNGVRQGTIVQSNRKISDSYFDCPNRPSRIDGISITGGDAGGGIYVNGYAHGLEIANNRVYGNAGAFGGGIRVGIPHLETQDPIAIAAGYDNNVNVHHNSITQNGLIEASGAVGGTPGASGAGAGLALCTGTNNYKANYNFVCGNYSSSDGGGIGHIGLSFGGTIANNKVLFNQSFFQQSATNGGGIVIEGEAAVAGGVSLGAGTVTVDSNLVQGNFAQGGHGGGIALMQVNGTDVNCTRGGCKYTNKVTLTNNMIIDNVAGWSAGGLYLQDAFNVNVVNNTVAMNDSVGIAGPLFNGGNNGKPNPAGIAADGTSQALKTLNSNVPLFSYPALLENNIVWHNRSFYANLYGTVKNPPNNVGLQGTATAYYSNAKLCASNNVTDTTTSTCPTLSTALTSSSTALQTLASGLCDANEKYWDLGLVGDSSAVPGSNQLSPTYSVLSASTGYSGAGSNNVTGDPSLMHPYCNSSQALSASSDEQGNFVDFRYGPLSQTAPVAYTGTTAGMLFADYRIQAGSSALDTGTASGAPGADFFGTKRPQGSAFDRGAHELVAASVTVDLSITKTDNRTNVYRGDSLTYTIVVSNNSTTSVTGAVVKDSRPSVLLFGVNIQLLNNWRWTCSGTACSNTNTNVGDINMTLGPLAPSASVTFTVTATVPNTALNNESIANTATVTAPAGVTDSNTANNTVTHTDKVVAGTTGTVTFTASTPPGVLTGNAANRTLAFGNLSGLQSSMVTLTSSVAGTIGQLSLANTMGTEFSLGTDNCSGKTLAAAGTCTVVVKFNAPPGNNQRAATLTVPDSATFLPQTLNVTGS